MLHILTNEPHQISHGETSIGGIKRLNRYHEKEEAETSGFVYVQFLSCMFYSSTSILVLDLDLPFFNEVTEQYIE